MNIATKLMASLVASVVLSACSGGSSSSSAQPNTEPTPKTNMPAPKAEQPKKEEGPQADSPKVEEPKEMAPQVGNPKVEEPKEMVPQIGNPKSNDPQVMIPKMDMPQKDDLKREDLNKDKSNAEILQELGIRDIKTGTLGISDAILTVKLDEQQNVRLALIDDELHRQNLKITNAIADQDIRTLKDTSGKLLGYYGYAQLNQVVHNSYDPNNPNHTVQFEGHYLLSMNDQERVQPTNSIKYNSNMLYSYTDAGSQKLVAEVEANYDHSTKMLSMQVFGKDGQYWKLGQAINNNRLPENRIDGAKVDKDGTVLNARLYSKTDDPLKLVPDANFSGGIFGKNGEVLAGKAESINNSWQGVIGATAK